MLLSTRLLPTGSWADDDYNQLIKVLSNSDGWSPSLLQAAFISTEENDNPPTARQLTLSNRDPELVVFFNPQQAENMLQIINMKWLMNNNNFIDNKYQYQYKEHINFSILDKKISNRQLESPAEINSNLKAIEKAVLQENVDIQNPTESNEQPLVDVNTVAGGDLIR